MRRSAIMVMSLLGAGCSFEGGTGSVGADAAVPDAAQTIDAAIEPDAAPADTDLDGIPDVDDNCPEDANDGQENEDGDAFGNACDLCIVIDDGATPQLDDDNDGIGNDCDPQPGVQNTLIFFEGFDTEIDSAQWTGEEVWTQDTAAGLMRRGDNLIRTYLTRDNVGGDDNIHVVASMDFDDENENGANFRFVGVTAESSNAGVTSQGCWLTRDNGDNERLGFVESTIAGGVIRRMFIAYPTTETVRYKLEKTTIGTDHDCFVSDAANSDSLAFTSISNFVGDDVGVVVSFSTANLYYLYAIRLQ